MEGDAHSEADFRYELGRVVESAIFARASKHRQLLRVDGTII